MQARAYLALQETLQDATFFAIHLKAFSGTTCSCLWLLVCQLWATKGAQKLPRGSQLEPKSVQTGALNPALWLTCASVPLWCLQSSRTGLEIVPNDGQHVMISIRKGTIKVKSIQCTSSFCLSHPVGNCPLHHLVARFFVARCD